MQLDITSFLLEARNDSDHSAQCIRNYYSIKFDNHNDHSIFCKYLFQTEKAKVVAIDSGNLTFIYHNNNVKAVTRIVI
jgi:hypothetical protein